MRKRKGDIRSSPRKRGPRDKLIRALVFALDSRFRGNERRNYRFFRFTRAIFSSTAQTEAVSCSLKPLFCALL